jgi:hypothetical protein
MHRPPLRARLDVPSLHRSQEEGVFEEVMPMEVATRESTMEWVDGVGWGTRYPILGDRVSGGGWAEREFVSHEPVAGRGAKEGHCTSDAGSVRSVGGGERRAELARRREERRLQREREEEDLRRQEDEELENADRASRAGSQLTEGALRVHNVQSRKDAERRLREIEHERELLLALTTKMQLEEDATDVFPTTFGSARQAPLLATLPLPHPFPHASQAGVTLIPPVRVAELSQKVKVSPPKPWKGSFVQAERDGWIRSAKGYLAGIGIGLKDRIDEELAPHAYYIVRGLMSSEAPTSGVGVSPQQWFDSVASRSPWQSAAEVFSAIEDFWVDDLALDRSVAAFRAARQKNLRAREFGALVESLAVACVGRYLSDDDRKEVFLHGLIVSTREYVDTQIRQLARQGRSTSFLQAVAIASDLDGRGASTSTQGLGKSAAKSSPSPNPTAMPTDGKRRSSSLRNWVDEATKWQQDHPMGKKAEWYRPTGPNAKVVAPSLRCYNCSKKGVHYSNNCDDPRVTPWAAKPLAAAVQVNLSDLPVVDEGEGKAGDE